VQPSAPVVEGVETIAVLRGNALGDLVVALPALEALRAAYPGARITLLGRERHRTLLCGRPSPVDDVVVLPEGAIGDESEAAAATRPEAFIEELAGRGWDLAVQLHGGGRNSNAFIHRLRPAFTAGSRTPDAPPLDRWIPYEHYQPEILRYLEVVGLVGAAPVVLEPRLTVIDADRDALAAQLPDLAGPGYAVLHPGATDPRRRWPVEAFAEVGRALASAGRRIVVTGVPAEADLLAGVAERTGGLIADRLSLTALLALLAGADVVVSNDTGPLHVAVAVGAPTVGIFWIGNMINAGPLTRRRHRPLASWRTVCPVCGQDATRERCHHDASFVADVPPAEAISAARALLGLAA
jgi:ADP-heptose:LPS heptosyltransferase